MCKNCEYFVQVSIDNSMYSWGNCTKLGNYTVDENYKKKQGAFTWADGACSQFRQKPQQVRD